MLPEESAELSTLVTPPSEPIIKVLVVDDSAFMRKALSMMLESDPSIKVIGSARDGAEGVEKVKLLKPDLVTMDIEMPRMDGLTALKEIMSTNPVPVMMVSSLTTDGANATLDALELGAVDFIPKQLSYVSLDIVKIRDELIAKIKDIVKRKSVLMARFRHQKFNQAKTGKNYVQRTVLDAASPGKTVSTIAKRNHRIGIVAIGSSTGGPPALQQIIPLLPKNLPVGVLIAQHMPAQFTKSLAERLDSLSQVTVVEAAGGEEIEAGKVYICPGQKHMLVRSAKGRSYIVVTDRPTETLYKPSVNILMKSVADQYGKLAMGVILTGMGSDGVDGMRELKTKGGVVIAQKGDTCVVYGMPKAVVEAKITDHIAPIDRVVNEIVSYF